MQGSYEGHWIYSKGSICEKSSEGGFVVVNIVSCVVTDSGHFAGATISVVS